MLGNSYIYDALVRKSTHCYTLWVVHNYPSDLNKDVSPPHSIWITNFMKFITISDKEYSTGTPTVLITTANSFEYRSNLMLPIITYFFGTLKKFNYGIFTNVIDFPVSTISFVNIPNGRWSINSLTYNECFDKENSVDEFDTSIYLQEYSNLLYHDSMSHCHIILSGKLHIKNWYWNS